MNSLYLLIIISVIFFPLVLSFDKKVHFFTNWKYLIPAIFFTMIIFIPWDILFTANGVWGFNKIYLTGIYFFNLPVEEVLFFIVVPYACIFIYEVLTAYGMKNIFYKSEKLITAILSIFLISTSLFFHQQIYTLSVSLLSLLLILLNQLIFKSKFLSFFYLSYLVMLIPFLFVNGILTGSFIPEEVVWYNDAEFSKIRLFTIPAEDIMYGFSLILMNLSIYYFLKHRIFKVPIPEN